MKFLTDIEIAQNCKLQEIWQVADRLGIKEKFIEPYGRDKGKVDLAALSEGKGQPGELILVTAMSPTPAGEGKTTITVGLADALQSLGKKSVLALREPSLGPVFGIKGGAAGGGYAQVVPMASLNLHFTGDFHAIGAANNLLAALIDNHIHQGNALDIDPATISWKRCVDMNDRQLRQIVSGLGGRVNGYPREDGFEITVASELMAILCLSDSIEDLKRRIGRITVAYNRSGQPVKAADLQAEGAMAVLLREAIKPNLVQTLEHTPAFVHGGPFANIAHGCNSILATKMALAYGDYVVTEAGFAADLGAEKFLDIKCRQADLKPSAVVLVATIRALKMHGGVAKKELDQENLPAVKKGLANLIQHAENLKTVFNRPVLPVINRFHMDSEAERALVLEACTAAGFEAVEANVWAEGGIGGQAMATKLLEMLDKGQAQEMTYAYDLADSLEEKIEQVARKVYRADGVEFSKTFKKRLSKTAAADLEGLAICMAKTQYSFSDDPQKLGAPRDFKLLVRDFKLASGAGFVVVYTGNIMTMPGLPKKPAACQMDLTSDGRIIGLS